MEQLYQTKKINDLVKVSDEAQKERDYIRSSLAVETYLYNTMRAYIQGFIISLVQFQKLQSGQNALQVIRGMVNRVGP